MPILLTISPSLWKVNKYRNKSKTKIDYLSNVEVSWSYQLLKFFSYQILPSDHCQIVIYRLVNFFTLRFCLVSCCTDFLLISCLFQAQTVSLYYLLHFSTQTKNDPFHLHSSWSLLHGLNDANRLWYLWGWRREWIPGAAAGPKLPVNTRVS